MKKGVYFLLGIIVGGLLTFGGCYVYVKMQTNRDQSEIRLAKHKKKFTEGKSFNVFQSFEDGALAMTSLTGLIVFLVADGDMQFYDQQYVTIPKGKSAIQIGTYTYESKQGKRTVPIIKFE